jgi:hypothetical protein
MRMLTQSGSVTKRVIQEYNLFLISSLPCHLDNRCIAGSVH